MSSVPAKVQLPSLLFREHLGPLGGKVTAATGTQLSSLSLPHGLARGHAFIPRPVTCEAGYGCYPHFEAEETEAQRGRRCCPRSQVGGGVASRPLSPSTLPHVSIFLSVQHISVLLDSFPFSAFVSSSRQGIPRKQKVSDLSSQPSGTGLCVRLGLGSWNSHSWPV